MPSAAKQGLQGDEPSCKTEASPQKRPGFCRKADAHRPTRNAFLALANRVGTQHEPSFADLVSFFFPTSLLYAKAQNTANTAFFYYLDNIGKHKLT